MAIFTKINSHNMAINRFKALDLAQTRQSTHVKVPTEKVTDYFGSMTFNDEVMRSLLSPEAYLKITTAIQTGSKIDRDAADEVAAAMKSWAISKGATHYTHWFQPLTGTTAEKHDSFFDIDLSNGKAVEKFKGSALVQQEPDASSFPNGGIRSTFEARGYTGWDPSSPAFIMENSTGTATLCVPSVFVSYTGEALDYKTPLLKSIELIDKAATAVIKEFFNRDVNKVIPTVGIEQEYFLVDEALHNARPDLMMAGRSVFGHAPAKGQQLEDHYFGSIPTRVLNYMRDLENECMLLGIPVKTRHNEVAPNQFELAPIFEETNLAVDHNSLLMDVMYKVAERHDFKVLMHEKPFKGVNGSGKHNNWSMATDTGINLLAPGKTPMSNLQFLTFFINTIKAVYRYEELLRASIASASNDHRLGANEAPPAIISVFIGQQLTKVLAELEGVTNGKLSPEEKTDLKLNVVGKIPDVLSDNTDRNRTSPFAFTGNKFEFRAVGSSANCANAMTTLNSIVAKQLKDFKVEVDALIEKKGLKKDEAIFNVLREYIKETKNILFEGDGYSEAWEKEAKKRGLSNHKTTPKALKAKVSKEAVKLFEELGVMNHVEVEARYEIELEEYSKKIQIEGRVLGDIARNHVIPTAIKYQNTLIENVKGLKEIFGKDFEKIAKEQIGLIKEISEHIEGININIDAMIEERKKANNLDSAEKMADAYCNNVKPYFEIIRDHSDKLELLVDDEMWTLTKYRELLFVK